ncbi:hypothetical protein OAT96_02540 [Chitinophagales bacterium]|nr:hypothetical protein [Chitinophagales bacterium]
MTTRIVILTWFICSYSIVNAQSWSKSFTAGAYDSNNKFLGGSEVLQLVNHKNMLFASVGYWEDENNIWYGGSNSANKDNKKYFHGFVSLDIKTKP